MQYDVLLIKQPDESYSARPVLMPEVVVSGVNEADALMRVRKAIALRQGQSRIVQIDVPASSGAESEASRDPWLRFAGEWGDDADWKQLQRDIDAFRGEIDMQTQDDE